MTRLIIELIRPYRWTLTLILLAMVVQTVMSLAGPWPLKIILDNVVGSHKLHGWLADLVPRIAGGTSKMHIAVTAAAAVVLIAVIGVAAASYVANYYTESVGQYVAHDLRIRTYHHLQRLSLRYYESHQVGTLLSTLTTDIATIQNFASSGTLGILVDLFAIIGMLGLMFYLNWDFALLAVCATPFLLLFMMRFKKAVKKATKDVRKNQSEIVAVAEQGLESQRVVKAYGRQDLEEDQLALAREPGDGRVVAQGSQDQGAALSVRDHCCRDMHCHRALARRRSRSRRSHDRSTVCSPSFSLT